ncbi:phage repressor protein [Acidovorax sp. Leaf84]|nr:phage repressor protein [Acidovorax sp. Leaf84]
MVSAFGLTQSQASYLSQLTAQESTASFGERSAKNWEERLRIPGGLLVNAGRPVGGKGAVVSALSPSPAPGSPVVNVPLLANAGSMGPGTDIQHDDVLVGHIALSEQWVARRLRPTSTMALRFIHAYGDSMSPTFEDGDVLLVDTGIRDPKDIDGVYVMSANDRVYIKRVRQRLDGVIEISSDNATVKTVDVLNGDHRIDILGRVVWCWNGRKL